MAQQDEIWIVQRNEEDGLYIENIAAYERAEDAYYQAKLMAEISDGKYDYLSPDDEPNNGKFYRFYQVEKIRFWSRAAMHP